MSLLRSDGLDATVMNLGESLWNTLESEAETSSKQTFHKPHRWVKLLWIDFDVVDTRFIVIV